MTAVRVRNIDELWFPRRGDAGAGDAGAGDAGAVDAGAGVAEETALELRRQRPFELKSIEGSFIDDSTANRAVWAKAAPQLQRYAGVDLGILVFRDVYVLQPLGLIVSGAGDVVYRGETLLWPKVPLARFFEERFGTATPETEDVRAHLQALAPRTVDSATLITAPGHGIYGHWIVDVLPRLMFARDECASVGSYAFFPKQPWMQAFVASISLDLDRFLKSPGESAVFVKRLEVPTATRYSSLLDVKAARTAWSAVRERLRAPKRRVLGFRKKRTRLYISRKRWFRHFHTPRMANAEAVEARFRSAGFEIVSPELLSLEAQVNLFDEAELIAGEDGSGLHNAVFSGPSARVGVLTLSDRINPIHASIAAIQGQKIGYFDVLAKVTNGAANRAANDAAKGAAAGDEGAMASLARVDEALDTLTSG